MTNYKGLAKNLKARVEHATYPPKRGIDSTRRFPIEKMQRASIVFVLAATCVFNIFYFLLELNDLSYSLNQGIAYGLFITAIFLGSPLLFSLINLDKIKRSKGFDRLFSKHYFLQHFLSLFVLFFVVNRLDYYFLNGKELPLVEFYLQWFFITLAFTLLYEVCLFLLDFFHTSKNRKITHKQISKFGLWLGQSTGKLATLSHGAAIAEGQEITLSLKDACQNIMCFGGIGSGKTSRLINPILLQLLHQDCGGLIFDIKSNFHQTVAKFADTLGKKSRVITLGLDGQHLSILEGLSPETAALFLKSSVMLGGGTDNAFWADTATQLCMNGLGVLQHIPGHYTLAHLHRYLFNPEDRALIKNKKLSVVAEEATEEQWQTIENYLEYIEVIFEKFDDRTKRNVLSTVSQVLEAFRNPKIIDAFCQSSNFTMSEVMNGTIYLLNLPLAEWGFGGKVIYNFIKLRFYNAMNKRRTHSEWNQERPVFFMCDEFQAVISGSSDGDSDFNFWDKARDTNTIGIVSSQSISSFYAAIQDRYIADTILGNFRQKICFKTEDQETLNYFSKLTGHVEVERHTYSKQTGSSERLGFLSSNASRSKSESKTLIQKSVIDSQLMRVMDPAHALAALSIKNYSCDDILLTGEVI